MGITTWALLVRARGIDEGGRGADGVAIFPSENLAGPLDPPGHKIRTV